MTVDLCSQQSWSCLPHWKPFKVGPHQQELTSPQALLLACPGSSSEGFLPGCREESGFRPGGLETYPFAP